MKKNNYFGRFCAILTIMVATFLTTIALGSVPVSAEEQTPGYRIGITPTFIDLDEVEPGETYDGMFKVMNTGSKDFEFTLNVTPYSVTDDLYSVD